MDIITAICQGVFKVGETFAMRDESWWHVAERKGIEDETTWISSSLPEEVIRSMWSSLDRGRNGDTYIFIHLVLHKSLSVENNGERDFHPQIASRLSSGRGSLVHPVGCFPIKTALV